MNEVKAAVLGIDVPQEIFDLWYEITYLRSLFSIVLEKNPDISEAITKETFEQARKIAQVGLKKRFPNVDLEYKSIGKGMVRPLTE